MIELIFEDRCSGCNTCVSVCPTHVFDPGPAGAPVIARQDQCQTCFMCELYCEADAIYVGPDQDHSAPANRQSILAAGYLGQLRRDYDWDEQAAAEPRVYWRLGPLLAEGTQVASDRYSHAHPEWVPPAPRS